MDRYYDHKLLWDIEVDLSRRFKVCLEETENDKFRACRCLIEETAKALNKERSRCKTHQTQLLRKAHEKFKYLEPFLLSKCAMDLEAEYIQELISILASIRSGTVFMVSFDGAFKCSNKEIWDNYITAYPSDQSSPPKPQFDNTYGSILIHYLRSREITVFCCDANRNYDYKHEDVRRFFQLLDQGMVDSSQKPGGGTWIHSYLAVLMRAQIPKSHLMIWPVQDLEIPEDASNRCVDWVNSSRGGFKVEEMSWDEFNRDVISKLNDAILSHERTTANLLRAIKSCRQPPNAPNAS